MKCKVAGAAANNSHRKEKNNSNKNHATLNSASVGTARTSLILLSGIHLYYALPDSFTTCFITENPSEVGSSLRSPDSLLLLRSTQPALVKGEVCPRGKQGPSCLQRRFSSAILPEEESHEKLVILPPSPHPSPQSTCQIFQFYRGTRASAQLGPQHLSVKDTLPWLHTPTWVASLSIGLFLPLSQSFSSSYLCLFLKASTCYVDLRERNTACGINTIYQTAHRPDNQIQPLGKRVFVSGSHIRRS